VKTAPAPKKTDRELLRDKATHISFAAGLEAEASYPLYDVLAYDRAADIVTIRQAMYPHQEPYHVNMTTLSCDCPHATGAVAKTNKALAEVGFLPSLHCKHPIIIKLKENDDPFVLDSAPEHWERKRAESLTELTELSDMGGVA
jgi:hypothetical protein